MKIEDVQRELTRHFLNCWKDEEGNLITPVILENEEIRDGDENSPWIRFSVEIFSFSADSMGSKGNRRVNRYGSIFVQVFVPLNEKTKELNDFIARVIRIYEGEKLDNIYFRNLRTMTTDEKSDSLWYGSTVTVEFDFTEII